MAQAEETFYAHVRAFSELLIVLRRELDNDLDKGVIMAIVAERHYEAMRTNPQLEAPLPDSPPSEPCIRSGGVNTYSLSLYSDIPRETVRRKVKELIAKGWLAVDRRGNLSPTGIAARDLQKATEATQKYMAALLKPARERN